MKKKKFLRSETGRDGRDWSRLVKTGRDWSRLVETGRNEDKKIRGKDTSTHDNTSG
jgi:hypothetical protein